MVHLSRSKIILIILACVISLLYAAPNALSPQARLWLQANMPAIAPQQSVNLGLDLRGGSHLLLEVDLDAVVADSLASLQDEVRSILRKAKINYTELGLRDGKVSFRVTDPTQQDAARDSVTFDSNIKVSVEGAMVTLAIREDHVRERKLAALDQSMEIVRRRVDESGTKEPSIQRQGENRILVQLPGIDDPQRIKALLGTTAKMSFRLVDEMATAQLAGTPNLNVPPGTEKLPTNDTRLPNVVVQKRVMVSGETLVDSQPNFDQYNQPSVSFRFDATGARKFGETTRNNVGKMFAIVLDNKVISFPRISEPILGGNGQITGSFALQEAKDLALLLRAGALPAPIKILEERTVGPGLGADSIKSGAGAALVGTGLVVLFMILSYGLFGIFGTLALIVNIAMIFGILSILQATLTLPGIAGIVLTIGTAVDANVLVFERIREEMRLGRSPIAAVDAGYRHALPAIMDANITTLISAVLLMFFGTGPIKGFGVTLTIGTVTSVFTAIWVTRLFVVFWLMRTKPKTIPI
ncbi:MAG: protein translocase subunit SecD [Alphaproteobacteria bacterium]|nr:protein translocase subunit SecD [Alphaproteobacteria bacterium]